MTFQTISTVMYAEEGYDAYSVYFYLNYNALDVANYFDYIP
jgi:hypothetical protein